MDVMSAAMSMLVAFAFATSSVSFQEPVMFTEPEPRYNLAETEVILPPAKGEVWGYNQFRLGEKFRQDKVTQDGMMIFQGTTWAPGKATLDYNLGCKVELPSWGTVQVSQTLVYYEQKLQGIEIDFANAAPKDPEKHSEFMAELLSWARSQKQGTEMSDPSIPAGEGIIFQDSLGNSFVVLSFEGEIRAVFMAWDFLQ